MTPPARFQDVLEGQPVPCLTCGKFLVLDRKAYEAMRYEVGCYRRAYPTRDVPPHLVRLVAKCLNGHAEVWHAEPPERIPEPVKVAAAVPAEDVECACGRTFWGRPGSTCSTCRSRKQRLMEADLETARAAT